MKVRTNIWIEDEEGKVAYGLGRQRILKAIRDNGSIKAAAEKLGMSYRGLWARLRQSEKRLGFPLTESKTGRGKDAGTVLTPQAVRLLESYARMIGEIYETSERSYHEHFEDVF